MKDCIFCKIINGDIPSKRVYEDDKVIAIMDINPVCDGHVLIIPKEHVTDYTGLSNDLVAHINDVASKIGPMLMEKLDTTRLTMAVNYGDAQEVKHFHLHLMPNYLHNKGEKNVDEVYELITK